MEKFTCDFPRILSSTATSRVAVSKGVDETHALKFFRMCQCHRPRRDPCSAANNHDVVVTHTAIKWEVHFQLKMLIGQAALTCSVLRKTDKIVSCVKTSSFPHKGC